MSILKYCKLEQISSLLNPSSPLSEKKYLQLPLKETTVTAQGDYSEVSEKYLPILK